VVIGRSPTDPIKGARFIPHPPGDELARRMQELVHWLRADHSGKIDPVVAAGMAH
jgi:Fic family protein